MVNSVKVVNLGKMGFLQAHKVQLMYARKILEKVKIKEKSDNVLLLVEHPQVYTVGIRTKGYTEADAARLQATGAEFHVTNRGGLITFHGPGQLVAYPVLNLQAFKPSMRWYICQLEKTLKATLAHFGLQGRTTDETGVWVGDRKIASIGVHGSRYVTTHGVALNVDVDLSWFSHIVPCGLEGVEMTSIRQELGGPVGKGEATQAFVRAFEDIFQCGTEQDVLKESELQQILTTDLK